MTVCQEDEADCGRILETLSSDSNDFETGYPDKYFYCYICVQYVKREQIDLYPFIPLMQYADWDQPIMPLLLANARISEKANFSPTPTTAYIARVRVSHENANVPPFSTFEAGRKLYMGDRYPEVPDSWEDRHTDAPTDGTLSTLVSTQAE